MPGSSERSEDFCVSCRGNDELAQVADRVEVCTDDGSLGFKGLVTDRLRQLIGGEGLGRPDAVVAIGPMAMMRAVAETTRAYVREEKLAASHAGCHREGTHAGAAR